MLKSLYHYRQKKALFCCDIFFGNFNDFRKKKSIQFSKGHVFAFKWAIVCLDPTHWMFQVVSISRNSSKCLQKLNKSTDFREIDATWNIRCVGSRRATLANETNVKTSESCGLTEKRIRALRAVFLTFLGDSKKCYYISM